MRHALEPEFQDYIRDQIAAGRFATPAEVIRHALLLQEEQFNRFEAMRKHVEEGIKDHAAGRVSRPTVDDIVADARAGKF